MSATIDVDGVTYQCRAILPGRYRADARRIATKGPPLSRDRFVRLVAGALVDADAAKFTAAVANGDLSLWDIARVATVIAFHTDRKGTIAKAAAALPTRDR